MHTLLTTYGNAKKSIDLLQTFPLDLETKNNIRKLREMLGQEEINQSQIKNFEKDLQNQKASTQREDISGQNRRERINCFLNTDSTTLDADQQTIRNKEDRQDFLERIVDDIQQLLEMNNEKPQDRIDASQHKQNQNNCETFGCELPTEVYSLLARINQQIKAFIKTSNETKCKQENNSNCSYNTHPNASNNSNSGSVRSLLTEKLRQFAQEDFDDPECKHERVIIQGNLMRQLSKYSRGSKPVVVSRRFQDLSEPFSMQNKLANDRELQNWQKNSGRKDQKGRVHSQRTILGQINLSDAHLKEKKAKKDETGCSRCEIY